MRNIPEVLCLFSVIYSPGTLVLFVSSSKFGFQLKTCTLLITAICITAYTTTCLPQYAVNGNVPTFPSETLGNESRESQIEIVISTLFAIMGHQIVQALKCDCVAMKHFKPSVGDILKEKIL